MTTDDPRDLTYAQALAAVQPWLDELGAHLGTHLSALGVQVLAAWQEIEPAVRAWVAQAETLTEQQWMDEPESTRALYDTLRGCVVAIDQQRASDDGEEPSQP